MGGGAAAIGDGTSGGAILITSKKNDAIHGHIDIAAGNFGTENVLIRFGQNVNVVSMGVNGIYDHTDGYRVNNDKTKNAPERVWGSMARNAAPVCPLITLTMIAVILENRSGPPLWPEPMVNNLTVH